MLAEEYRDRAQWPSGVEKKTNLDGKDLGRLHEIDHTETWLHFRHREKKRKSAGWNRTGDEGAKPETEHA